MKTIGHDIGIMILNLDDEVVCPTIGRIIYITIISDDEVEIHRLIIIDE